MKGDREPNGIPDLCDRGLYRKPREVGLAGAVAQEGERFGVAMFEEVAKAVPNDGFAMGLLFKPSCGGLYRARRMVFCDVAEVIGYRATHPGIFVVNQNVQ